jgi:hypothetical protein
MQINMLSQAIGLYFIPVIAFVFMYCFITVVAQKEHNHLYKLISSICFAIIVWTITSLMMILH